MRSCDDFKRVSIAEFKARIETSGAPVMTKSALNPRWGALKNKGSDAI